MAVFNGNAVSAQLGQHSHAYQRVTPALYYVVRGRNGGGTLETWVSRGAPDMRAGTHTQVAVLAQWYVAP